MSASELDEIREFGYTQLGFVMRLNWNVSIETIDCERTPPSLNTIR